LAKNLKLNIKNAQLAEALKLNQIKKPAGKKKEAAAAAPEAEAKAEAPVSPPAPKEEPAAALPPVQPIREAAAPASAPAAPIEKERAHQEDSSPSATQPPVRPAPAPASHYQHRYAGGQPTSGYRPPYRPHPQNGGGRPPYNAGPRPPHPGGPRPPYQPRPGGHVRPGDRPTAYRPHQPRPQTPPPQIPPKATDRPAGKPHETEQRKPAGFKEYRDLKPQKRTDQRAFDVRDRQGLRSGDDEGWRKKRPSHKPRVVIQEETIRPKNLSVRLPISIKDLASEMKVKASQLISKLFMQGVVVTLNDLLDDETTIQLLGHEFDCEIKIDTSEEQRLRITEKTIKEEIQETTPEELMLRPPVVTFMGHVDHGKTSLIDAIRKSNIASGEAGAITQHIGAFKCHTAVGDLCILDTPGHEAFSAMRARGADVTDIVVLVIAGDEGIRTQTQEAINQARAANVPIVVALNKSDKPNFNPENIYRQLADIELLPEAWGGATITVNCSAVTGAGIKELLEMLALQAEILELKADPKTRARGTVIESEMHKGLGPVATVLVQTGTLRLGEAIVFAQHWARVKTMHDENNRELSEAPPSTPVKITGLSGLPGAGSEFIVVKNEREARELSEGRVEGQKQRLLHQAKRAGLENLLQQKAESAVKKILNVILKADVQGSLEALKNSLQKILSNKVELNIVSAEVGEVSESDVQLAAASNATILGFHTQVERHAESLIKQMKVTVKLHDIIYHAVDDIRAQMKALLDKIPQETDTGTAEVKTTFKSSQLGMIAGCQITEGLIKRNHHIRLIRNKEVVWKGEIASLKRMKEDVREVSKGYECGILLQNYNDVKEGDILQAFEITYLEQDL
jgi:translation initiation factor IF-2